MAKTGRPTKYKKEYCQGIIDYFKNFEPYEELPVKETVNEDNTTTTETKRFPVAPPSLSKYATSIDVCRDTLHEWKKNNPEFSDAFRKAKDIYEDIYIDGGLLGYYHHGFTALCMQNRFEWVSKSESKSQVEVTTTEELTDKELDDQIESLANQG